MSDFTSKRRWCWTAISAVTLTGALMSASTALADPLRVLASGQLPTDTRLGPLRGETGDFSFTPAANPESWQARARRVRQILLVTLGLWPMPTELPVKPQIHGRVKQEDYTVEKVYFESVPGLYITGNLYRPKGKRGRRPAVLSPHGHFPGGRFQDAGLETAQRLIAKGAEQFEDAARSFMQSRCVHLARMGCVVFHYDMIGYGDCQQIPLDVVHRFSRLRREFHEPPESGFYSASAELNLHNPMGLHTYHSIRALDFLLDLPDVDPKRIAVTGGSGGGTQTFMLSAVDDRPRVSVPVVIVSTTRQGGCTCENISGLRIGTYNLEFTALHAPKPLLLISADDATRTMSERGFPELLQHYKMLGRADHVSHVPLLQFPHNYNMVSRTAMYRWLDRHLGIGIQEPIRERPYQHLSEQQLTVWNHDHPRPDATAETESAVLDWLTQDAKRQIDALIPRDARSLEQYRDVVGTAWRVLLRGLPPEPHIQFKTADTIDRGDHQLTLGLLSYRSIEDHAAELPVVRLSPKESGRRTVVWLDRIGKAGLVAPDGSLASHARRLLDAGVTVVGVDLLEQGEFLQEGQPVLRQRWLEGEEAFAGWTYCYNLPLFARRVHDVLAVVEWAKRDGGSRCEIDLVGLSGAGRWAAAAVALAPEAVTRAAIDTDGFRFGRLSDVYHVDFVPGAAKYHDLPGLLALAAPTRLWLAGESDNSPAIVRAAYEANQHPERLEVISDESRGTAEAATDWLLGHP
ncbi:MAG: acetylxylan esterase [Planctomycetes bacterium]|nr:acetylxylan esterase [Planctomycetota bacterium]MBL7037588.1 acetylxylan esterase [Pirellulaceae bacterium]